MSRTKGPIERTKMMTILLSEEEHDRIRALAADRGLDVSSFVRSVFRDAWKKFEVKGKGKK